MSAPLFKGANQFGCSPHSKPTGTFPLLQLRREASLPDRNHDCVRAAQTIDTHGNESLLPHCLATAEASCSPAPGEQRTFCCGWSWKLHVHALVLPLRILLKFHGNQRTTLQNPMRFSLFNIPCFFVDIVRSS